MWIRIFFSMSPWEEWTFPWGVLQRLIIPTIGESKKAFFYKWDMFSQRGIHWCFPYIWKKQPPRTGEIKIPAYSLVWAHLLFRPTRGRYYLAQTSLHPTRLYCESIQNYWYNSQCHCYRKRVSLALLSKEFKRETGNKAAIVYWIKIDFIGRAEVASEWETAPIFPAAEIVIG